MVIQPLAMLVMIVTTCVAFIFFAAGAAIIFKDWEKSNPPLGDFLLPIYYLLLASILIWLNISYLLEIVFDTILKGIS